MALRLIHTADVHLDACYADAGMSAGFGTRRRQGLREALARIVARAQAWPADALLIAGDLFDLERVSPDTVAFLRAQFDGLGPTPVFIAPGNRDPYVPGSPYASAAWPGNVMIFDQPTWTSRIIKDRDLAVHGIAFDGPDGAVHSLGDLLTPRRAGWTQVALAHGSERTHLPAGRKSVAPFDVAQVQVEDLAYLALGHYHAALEVTDGPGTVAWYAGAPEGHGFDEAGPRHHLEVEILEDTVRVTPVVSSQVVYGALSIDCSSMTSGLEVVEAIRRAADGDACQVARVSLEGVCASDLHLNTAALHDAVASAFEAVRIEDNTVASGDGGQMAQDYTCLGLFVRRINAGLDAATTEEERRLLRRARELGVTAFRRQAPAAPDVEGA